MSSQVPQRTQPAAASEMSVAGDFSVRYLFEILFRRKRVLLATMVLTPVLSTLIGLIIQPSYLSTTTILLGKNEILNPLVRFDMAVAMTEWNRLGSFQKVIYSRPLIEDAIHQVGLDRNIKTDIEIERMVVAVRRSTIVLELSGDSFQIGYSAPNAVLAKNMVETITRLFIDKSLTSSRREALSAVDFLQKESDQYQAEHKRIIMQLQEFQMANREPLSASRSPIEIDKLRNKIHDVETQLMEQQLYAQLYRDRMSGKRPMVSVSQAFAQTSPYQVHYQELQLQMGNLLATRNPSHPEVLKKQREMDYILALLKEEKEEKDQKSKETTEMRSGMYLETMSRLDDVMIKVAVLEKELQELNRQRDDFIQKQAKAPELVQEEQRLEDASKLTRAIYDSLSMKLEEARVTSAVEVEQQASRFSIVEPARVPLNHYKPLRLRFALAGILGGMLLGLMLVFLLEFTDPLLIRPGELVRSTGLPLLGALPKLHRGSRKPGWYIPAGVQMRYAKTCARLQSSSRLWIARLGERLPEACALVDRLLHWAFGAKRFELSGAVSRDFLLTATRLQQAGQSRDPNELALDDFSERVRHIGIAIRTSFRTPEHLVCMVASTKRGEGKTLLTANLGVVLASDLKEPMLLVDTCLGSAELSAMFQRADAPGLGDILDGRATLDGVLTETGTPNLWLLPAGRTQEYAEGIFNGDSFPQILERLRERFSVVLIETPDLGTHSNGLLIAPHTDGVLILSRLYDTRKKAIEAALQRLPREKIVGLVTNFSEYWIPDWLYRWV
ncbi:MAG: exopolysaccharide transport family protein [Kiritimatiellia bacterium]